MSMRKKPWNRLNLPVYSISSHDGNGNHNMHIITYASQISMQPKQFVCGIYYGTKTLENIEQHNRFVLQVLSKEQYGLVNMLGKKSGKTTNKMAYLLKRGLTETWNGYFILKDALAVIEMEALPLPVPENNMPDHALYLCNVLAYKNINKGEALTIDVLREKGIVRM